LRLCGAISDPSCDLSKDPAHIPRYLPPDASLANLPLRTIVAEVRGSPVAARYPGRVGLPARARLRDETIRHFHLGYCAPANPSAIGREIGGLYVPRGL